MLLEPHLAPGDGVLDIGGFDGAFAEGYAKCVGKTGHVVCVEPDIQSVQQAAKRTAAYPWVELVHAACMDYAGTAVLYHDSVLRARNSLWRANVVKDAGTTEEVPCVTLDVLAARVRRLKGIKIDAQGAERHILDGGTKTLQHPSLVWQIELWPVGLMQAGSSVREVCERFREAGWQPSEGTWEETIAKVKQCHKPYGSADIVVMR